MLYLKKICVDNHIDYKEICKFLNISYSFYFGLLNKKVNFNLDILFKFKDFFVKKEILTNEFDIGDFLNEVD